MIPPSSLSSSRRHGTITSKRLGHERLLKEPIPRDHLVNERFNVKLVLEAKVHHESYIYTGSFIKAIPIAIPKSLYRLIDEYLSNPTTFDKLVKKVNEELKTLVSLSPSKEVPRYGEKIIIPGSSVKGAIRSRVEYKLSPSLSCYSVEGRGLPPSGYYKRHVKFWGDEVLKGRGSCNPQRGDNRVCLVCDLFGAPGLASRIHFSDLEMIKGSTETLRDLGVEVIRPNSEFKLTINILNCDFVDLGLLFLGLELFSQSPIMLCAYKYRFNPQAGGAKYKDKFFFGLLRFYLKDFNEVLSTKLTSFDVKSLIDKAKSELMGKYKDHVFLNRGIIEKQ